MKRFTVSLALALFCNCAPKAFAEVADNRSQNNPSISGRVDEKAYQQTVLSLGRKYNNSALADCFEKASKDPDNFISHIQDLFLTEHSRLYAAKIKTGLESARKKSWLQSEKDLSASLNEKPDLPDIILLKAVAERQTENLAGSLADLEYLYKLLDERREGYKRSTDSTKDNAIDEIYDQCRTSDGHLVNLRERRAEDYERTYSQYSKALSSFGVNCEKAGS
jgi:hypothetical protein